MSMLLLGVNQISRSTSRKVLYQTPTPTTNLTHQRCIPWLFRRRLLWRPLAWEPYTPLWRLVRLHDKTVNRYVVSSLKCQQAFGYFLSCFWRIECNQNMGVVLSPEWIFFSFRNSNMEALTESIQDRLWVSEQKISGGMNSHLQTHDEIFKASEYYTSNCD